MNFKQSFAVVLIGCVISAPGFAKNDKHGPNGLPPGLQKKVAMGQPLPPGWQKKLTRGAIMDRQVFDHGRIVVPVDSKGLLTVSIDGKLVRLYQDTREIIDILD